MILYNCFFRILLIYFLVRTEFTFGFSSGAPLTACEGEMIPRHGFEPQVWLGS